MLEKRRTSWQVTRAVWHAMFLHEVLARTTADRFAWFWMLVEPIAMVAIMAALRGVFLSGRHIAGADFIPWLITGLLGFYLFRENLQRSLKAIDANKGLFAYRQVQPVDPVLVRCFLEGMLKSLILVLFVAAGELLGIEMMPSDVLAALYHWWALWCLGFGAALTASALAVLIAEVAHIVQIAIVPLFFISGVILPLNFLPHWVQKYLLWNPIVHGIESLRASFFSSYRMVDGVDMFYFWCWTLSFVALGLMLHTAFARRLKAQ